MSDLLSKKCVPCEGGMLPLTEAEVKEYLTQVHGWSAIHDSKKILKAYKFKDFAGAMVFANQIAALAEEEGHHPMLLISWGKVAVELKTDAIDGLSENDFILAAKIDELNPSVL